MRLPEVAERLRELAVELSCSELDELADQIKRRPVRRRADPTSRPMTRETARAILAALRVHPEMTQAKVSELFDVNQGRVSEVLRGKRK